MSIQLNGIFKDGMILQRDKEIRVFGITDLQNGTKISASLNGRNNRKITSGQTSEIFEDGSFVIRMPATEAGGPYKLNVSSPAEEEKIKISGVYVGEVWFAGGQSNMEYQLGRVENARRIMDSLPDMDIHFYAVPVAGTYDEAQCKAEKASEWIRVDRDNCFNVSAIGYFFSYEILENLKRERGEDVHIGIIGCYLGGTSVSCWQSTGRLDTTPAGQGYLEAYHDEVDMKTDEEYAWQLAEYDALESIHQQKIKTVLDREPSITYAELDQIVGPGPWPPPMGRDSIRRPGALFDTMVLRVAPYGIKGFIFYQGEEDCEDHANDYAVVFKSMIEEWREVFLDNDLPFIFCQLPMYISKERRYMCYDDMKWPKLREQQAKAAREMDGVHMAVLVDCGEFDNIHPSDKKTPGFRLAMLALRFAYGFGDVPAVSPYVIDARRGEGVEISFAGDFATLNLISQIGVTDTGFEIAGEDGLFHPAEAAIDFDGRTVLLKCPAVEYAMKVRYAFFSYGTANLVADTGLAAAPFEVRIDTPIGEYY